MTELCIDGDKARRLFALAKELHCQILDAQEDLKQMRADAVVDLIPEGTDRDEAKAIRAELAEIVALAKIEAQGELAREKAGKKIALRQAVAAKVGVQLDIFGGVEPEVDTSGVERAVGRMNALLREDGATATLKDGAGNVLATFGDALQPQTDEPAPVPADAAAKSKADGLALMASYFRGFDGEAIAPAPTGKLATFYDMGEADRAAGKPARFARPRVAA